MSSRFIATKIVKKVIEDKHHLSSVIQSDLLKQDHNEKALIQEICYGSCRWYIQLNFILDKLLDKAIKPKDIELKYLLLIGLYQLMHMKIAPHAVVSETVSVCVELKKKWAKGFVNAILRCYLRDNEKLIALFRHDIGVSSAHPEWFIKRIKNDWPEHWQNILTANNQRPPMYIRVNQQLNNREQYLKKLDEHKTEANKAEFSDTALLLANPLDVNQLPGFKDGLVSVQDLAAQLAVDLLDLETGQDVLDACAAPGGKSAHILEAQPTINSLTTLEKDAKRAEKMLSTFERLKLNAKVNVCDALKLDQWWDKTKFDRILLDAPCSATGVIRRNPDIKILRTPDQIENINVLQSDLLSTLWNTLKDNGLLLYVTCSVLKQENTEIIRHFIRKQADCMIENIDVDWGIDTGFGRQILTGENNMDGFFYARLRKVRPC